MRSKRRKRLFFTTPTFRDEDLLEREPIVLDQENITGQIQNSRILITGAAGSIGNELAAQICTYLPQSLVLLDQSETLLGELEATLAARHPAVKILAFVANITDAVRIANILSQCKPQIIFHAAAYKHVPIMEKQPYEAIKTNVLGTQILADAAVKSRVKKFIFVSTDKAVNPSSVMGATKRMAELYIQGIQQTSSAGTRFIITRFGNVLGSNGSFLCVFKKQIASGGPITITDANATRYLMTTREACQLVLEASAIGKNGQILYFDMGAPVLIQRIAEKMTRQHRLKTGKEIKIEYIGLRPGEKLKEELSQEDESICPFIHPKIRLIPPPNIEIADFKALNKLVTTVLSTGKQDKMVTLLKLMVPEYISENSDFGRLDFAR